MTESINITKKSRFPTETYTSGKISREINPIKPDTRPLSSGTVVSQNKAKNARRPMPNIAPSRRKIAILNIAFGIKVIRIVPAEENIDHAVTREVLEKRCMRKQASIVPKDTKKQRDPYEIGKFSLDSSTM
jgi:hypothetical protein